jgi:hypothetical protein
MFFALMLYANINTYFNMSTKNQTFSTFFFIRKQKTPISRGLKQESMKNWNGQIYN